MSKPFQLILTCEHAGNAVPQRYARLFEGCQDVLASHRGHDIGALALAETLSRTLSARLYATTATRLLIDCNRSPGNARSLFSEFTRTLDPRERAFILDSYHRPHWNAVESAVASEIQRGKGVLHLGVHTFTPVLKGRTRRADVGLLYDPSRPLETGLCRWWQEALCAAAPKLTVRRNYPYRGTGDSLPGHLRIRFPEDGYLGIEIEVNQQHAVGGGRGWSRIRKVILETLDGALASISKKATEAVEMSAIAYAGRGEDGGPPVAG